MRALAAGLFGMVVVDGDHRDEGMRADFLNALKLVRPGGAVVMDDYDWAGVKKAPAALVSRRLRMRAAVVLNVPELRAACPDVIVGFHVDLDRVRLRTRLAACHAFRTQAVNELAVTQGLEFQSGCRLH